MRPMLLFLAAILLAAQTCLAGPLLWQHNNLLLLHGDDYRVDPAEQTTLTLEHASGWGFGDLFLFVDLTRFDGPADDTYYGELSPRFSLGKLGGTPVGAGPITDLLLATTYEFGKGDVESLLLGPGLDLKLPGFDYFQVNLYRRFPGNGRDGETLQLTPVWGITWPVMGTDLVFEGFVDWNFTADGAFRDNLHFNPRLKFDLGKALDLTPGSAYLGVEYSYWSNKYGIADSTAFRTDESALSGFLNLSF